MVGTSVDAANEGTDFQVLFERAPGLYLILAPSLEIVTASDAYCSATMTERRQIVGRHLFDVFPDNPDDPAADGVANLRTSLSNVLQFRRADAMAVQKYDVRKPAAEGGGFEERYWSPLNTPVLGPDGEVRWIIHSVEDVTELMRTRALESARAAFVKEQQQAAERLREANRELAEQMEQITTLRRQAHFFYLLVESSNDAIITQSPDGKVLTWNKAAERMLGYPSDEMTGRTLAKLRPHDRKDELDAVDSRLWAGEKIANFETVWLRKDGTEVVVSFTVSPIRDERREIVAASTIARDITAQKRADDKLKTLQEELIHLARWNTMGMMASTIAHELNQPLTAILNYVKAARRLLAGADVANLDRVNDYLDRAANETKLAGGITRTLREFIEQRKTSRTSEDINGVVAEAVELGFAGGAEVKAMLELRLEPGLASVSIDRVQIQQVLLNLIRNGVDAMQGLKERRLTVATGASQPGFVEVRVSDTGPGIAPEIQARLFQPFVTTKQNGMGIGLTICQSIIEVHGGRIWCNPNEESGVSFHFSLPAAAPGESRSAA